MYIYMYTRNHMDIYMLLVAFIGWQLAGGLLGGTQARPLCGWGPAQWAARSMSHSLNEPPTQCAIQRATQ